MNHILRDELLAMAKADQESRRDLLERGELFQGYHPEMEALHQKHNQRLSDIIDVYGWPTKSLVGEEASGATWLILQHSVAMPSLMRRGLVLVREAVANHDADPKQVAYLEDRICIFEGRPQRYGTQYDWNEAGEMEPCPIEDHERVNERRSAVGLDSLEENTKRVRESLQSERPPIDQKKRREERLCWEKKVGWR